MVLTFLVFLSNKFKIRFLFIKKVFVTFFLAVYQLPELSVQ